MREGVTPYGSAMLRNPVFFVGMRQRLWSAPSSQSMADKTHFLYLLVRLPVRLSAPHLRNFRLRGHSQWLKLEMICPSLSAGLTGWHLLLRAYCHALPLCPNAIRKDRGDGSRRGVITDSLTKYLTESISFVDLA